MKRHLVTVALLLVAIVFYLAGLSGAGILAFAVGVVFESWFWVRVLVRRNRRVTSSSR
jgi:hypothetical protein